MKLTLNVNAQVHAKLIELMSTGLFGNTVEQVADELLRHRLRELIREGANR
jgi:hypothetical protein